MVAIGTIDDQSQRQRNKRQRRNQQRRAVEAESRGGVLVAPGEEPTPMQSPIDQLFEKIYESIDKHVWADAKTNVEKLQQLLRVTSGRESRARGGWKYSCDFILDSVLFADLLCRLQDDADVMTQAVNKTLGLVATFRLSVCDCLCVCVCVWEILGLGDSELNLENF